MTQALRMLPHLLATQFIKRQHPSRPFNNYTRLKLVMLLVGYTLLFSEINMFTE